jgi:putative addiction module component (TIGR02574 family)
MTKRAEQLLTELLQLNTDDRAFLADALLQSVEPSPDAAEQDAMLERRVLDFEEGKEAGEQWEDVRARVMARFDNK